MASQALDILNYLEYLNTLSFGVLPGPKAIVPCINLASSCFLQNILCVGCQLRRIVFASSEGNLL